uniref:Alpha/beta hydrolase n=1 Tax=Thermogemmatispora argillosa TaxID=2045280 RepID=A0A455T7Q9_9CHLR|nr:alpha/beta hydrolase [Thermogemmatispora argillosa]
MAISSAPTERSVIFPSKGQPSFMLEGILHYPGQARQAPAAVLCHPQPASSDMQDVLTLLLARRLAEQGMIALRFNFRGVGRSQGQQTDGRLEPLDLAGAVDFILAQPGVNPAKLCVIGHAFGAYIALQYAPYDPRIRTVVAISLPLFRAIGGLPRQFERPKLFVTGEFDEVCPLYKLEPFVEQQKGPKGIKVITGARHLMRGYEEPAIEAITRYLKRWAEMPDI